MFDTFTENIGAGGLCVILDKDPGIFSELSLELYLGNEDAPITCSGTVVWVVKRHPMNPSEPVKFDTGIEFTEISDENRAQLSQLVENILQAGA